MAKSLIEDTQEFVFNLFKKELPNTFIYHNYTHTERVYKSTKELIENSEVTDKEAEVLELSALLHDVGYTKTIEGHEEESVNIATEFLEEKNVDKTIIKSVSECIMATKFESEPDGKLERIIRDADSSHFGKDYFEEASEFLRKELELHRDKTYSTAEWREGNIKVLSKKHKYYTDYAIKNWQKQKDKNLQALADL